MTFVRAEVLSDTGLRDGSLTALDDPVVRERLSTIVTGHVRGRMPDSARARVDDRAIAQAVDRAIEQPAFRAAFGSAVQRTRDDLVDRHPAELRLPLDDIVDVLTPHLAEIDPQIAAQTEDLLRGDSILIARHDDLEAVARTIQVARVLGIILPITAALCFALAFLIARRRANVVTGVGIAVLVAGVAIVVSSYVGRRIVESMADPAHTDVASAVWSAFAGSLSTWGLITAVTGGGILLAGLVMTLVSGRNRYLAGT